MSLDIVVILADEQIHQGREWEEKKLNKTKQTYVEKKKTERRRQSVKLTKFKAQSHELTSLV